MGQTQNRPRVTCNLMSLLQKKKFNTSSKFCPDANQLIALKIPNYITVYSCTTGKDCLKIDCWNKAVHRIEFHSQKQGVTTVFVNKIQFVYCFKLNLFCHYYSIVAGARLLIKECFPQTCSSLSKRMPVMVADGQ